MNNQALEEVLRTIPIISGMVTNDEVSHILNYLYKTIENNVPGDIVELGCNVGTTSLFIRRLMDETKTNKKFFVYDSFEGLPEKTIQDQNTTQRQFVQGQCKTSLETFKSNFAKYGLKEPKINVGWFKEIDDALYPEKISFAFFDGDFYTSIMDSFEKVYHKLSPGAALLIHDYGWEGLPGVENACNEFLKDKPEKVQVLGQKLGVLIKK